MCQTMHQWLQQDAKNVAVIHCKVWTSWWHFLYVSQAGKGRTGVAICAYMLYSGMQPTADKSLAFYAQRRTKNNKGVTIPSQCRTIYYLETILKNANWNLANLQTPFPKQKLRAKKLRLVPAPKAGIGIVENNNVTSIAIIYYLRNSAFELIASNAPKMGSPQVKRFNPDEKEATVALDTELEKDVLFEVYDFKGGKEVILKIVY